MVRKEVCIRELWFFVFCREKLVDKKILLNFNNIDLLNIIVFKEYYSIKIISKFVFIVFIE